jgi:hypothetical protein
MREVMLFYDSHPNLDALELHLLSRLPDCKNREVEEHLLICESCQTMAAKLLDQITLIQSTLAVDCDC